MNLTVLDTNLNVVDIVDTYSSLIWTERYYAHGDFELYTSTNPKILDVMREDYYLARPDSDRAMIIDTMDINSESEDGSYLTITGKSLESILNRRIVWKQTTLNGDLQNGIKKLLDENIISPANPDRKINNFIFEASDDPAITKLTIRAQYTGDNLYDVIHSICKEAGIGFKITFDDNYRFVFRLYAAKDRSYEQFDNPYVVFSPNFENLLNSNYIHSKAGLKNVVLIGGEGEGAARKFATVGVANGLNRREIFRDARDVSSDVGDGVTLTDEEYTSQLQQRGKETLAENTNVVSFEGEAETNFTFKYGEDFFIGDIVQIANEYGHEARSRIVEVVMTEDEEGSFVYPTFENVMEGEIA